ncbi:MAG: hypothetical protein DLM58_19660 [Pseudonocardiales bacterium]|nr:MAG: hypothetical protein DLM58_19660 [Pseudonocardiales bacterium]
MSASEIVTAVSAFLGGGLGSVLAFWATRNATRLERGERRREEWGRRFTAAVEAFTDTDDHRAAIGRALLLALLDSALATMDDRQLVESLLDADATYNPIDTSDLRIIVPREELDDTRVVEDDEAQDQNGEANS